MKSGNYTNKKLSDEQQRKGKEWLIDQLKNTNLSRKKKQSYEKQRTRNSY